MKERRHVQVQRAVNPERPAQARPTRSAAAGQKGGRESIESFVVVFLAFLIWSIEAEGFVIPTGSMAPTLMGRHKEIVCPQCGYVFTVNADREVDTSGTALPAGRRIETGVCENCRFPSTVSDAPSFSGDRIYVVKKGVSLPFTAPPEPAPLKRFDVAVFKLPEEPEIRYIKRLVGMPNEVIRIEGGDLWRKPLGDSPGFERLHRSFDHQQAMAITVYDDRHRPRALADDPRWLRWRPATEGDWAEPTPGNFAALGRSPGWAELRYHHLVPTPDQWQDIRSGVPTTPPRGTLVTDYSSYNTDLAADEQEAKARSSRVWFQPHWVGDLTLSCRVTVPEQAGALRLNLVKSGESHRCEIDMATGTATLFSGDQSIATAPTPITRPGRFNLIFANVDDRLTLAVDGQRPFGDGVVLPPSPSDRPPTDADLEPARIAVRGTSAHVDSLVLTRDIYYTIDPAMSDFADLDGAVINDPSSLFDVLADPARYARLVHRKAHDYPVSAGHYLMLGDNSPWSRDARAWGQSDQRLADHPGHGWDDSGRASWEVPETLVIGKAFCVYWPHPKPVWPRVRLGPDLRLPILPYIERMRWIR